MPEIKNLYACVGNREILHDVTFMVGMGEIHALLGPNGSGSSSPIMSAGSR